MQITLAGWGWGGVSPGTCYTKASGGAEMPLTFSINGTYCVPSAGFIYDDTNGCYCWYELVLTSGYERKGNGTGSCSVWTYDAVNWSIDVRMYAPHAQYSDGYTSQSLCDTDNLNETSWIAAVQITGGVKDAISGFPLIDSSPVFLNYCPGISCWPSMSCGNTYNYTYNDSQWGTGYEFVGSTPVNLQAGTITVGVALC